MPSIQVFNIELASAITENPYLEYLDLSWLKCISKQCAEILCNSDSLNTINLSWVPVIDLEVKKLFDEYDIDVEYSSNVIVQDKVNGRYVININDFKTLSFLDLSHLSWYSLTVNVDWANLSHIDYYLLSKFNWKKLSIIWLKAVQLLSWEAQNLVNFNWDILEVWINWWSFSNCILEELIKFHGRKLIISWFDSLLIWQEKILLRSLCDELWVHWKYWIESLSPEQYRLFSDYEVSFN
jgi:hypothetical protein